MAFREEEIEQSIPARFEQQVRRYPKRSAVQTRTQILTYEALNRAANGVAHAITAHLATDTQPIGLLFDHGSPTIIAILGAFKAGKFYLPPDPALPPARLTLLLTDAQAELALTNTRNLTLARSFVPPGTDVLNLDTLA